MTSARVSRFSSEDLRALLVSLRELLRSTRAPEVIRMYKISSVCFIQVILVGS